MKINATLITLCLLITGALCAQPAKFKNCATVDAQKHREALTPGYMAAVKNAFDNAKAAAGRNTGSRAVGDTIIKIRTVFHVVYTSATDSLDESVILSQVEVLNQDYRRKNPDTINTRADFKPLAADAGIEFFLATEDPDGNPTTGIVYTKGTPSGFFGFTPFTDNVKDANEGAACWPTDKYLNIWVCDLGFFGVLGYAYPPVDLPNWPAQSTTDSFKQGVVLDYRAVGNNNPAPYAAEADGGRSATHEIGHYLGLRHIWGDDSGKCTDNGGEDDGIDDTPESGDASQQTCNLNINSCTDPIVDYDDMIENFMDYSDDDCLNMFTKGQVAFMRSVLMTYRPGVAEFEVEQGSQTPNAIANTKSISVCSVYPNPAGNVINVVAKFEKAVSGTVTLRDITGKVMESVELNNTIAERLSFDAAGLASGVYMIQVKAGAQTITRRVVKQ
jgi:hypothetical protein